jgi:sirohydrochlorin ferrochelatase
MIEREQLSSRTAAILVGHGERGGARSNTALRAHCARVAEALEALPVAAGVLSGEPSLEEALARLRENGAQRLLLYPFFMSTGYFVTRAIPQRVAAAGLAASCEVLTPLGADARLVPLMMREARAAAARLGAAPDECRLLLAGHGSENSRASAEATMLAARRLADMSVFAEVTAAFLEEPPFLPDALAAAPRPTVVVGFFSGEGLHAAEDVPEALAASRGPTIYTGAIGALPDVADLMRDAIAAAHAPNGNQCRE